MSSARNYAGGVVRLRFEPAFLNGDMGDNKPGVPMFVFFAKGGNLELRPRDFEAQPLRPAIPLLRKPRKTGQPLPWPCMQDQNPDHPSFNRRLPLHLMAPYFLRI